MRRILTGLLTLAMAAMATAASAQTSPKPAQIIVNNAPAGIDIDIFIDAGKMQTVRVNQQGSTGFDLDFLSLGKPKGQVYIETCQDGQRIRIVSDGTDVATEDGCNRKPVGVLFTFTCTKKITLNFAAAKASFAGCGTLLTNKYLLTGGAILTGGLVVVGGGGDPTAPPAVFTPPQITATPAAPAPTPTPTAPTPAPTTPTPAPTTPAPPAVGNPGGTQTIASCTVGSDPAAHNAVLRFCSQLRDIIVSASSGGMTLTGSIIWVTLSGGYNTTSGAFDLSRNGPLAGTAFTAVDFRFVGTIDANGHMSGVVTIGGQGLPGGQAITYNITTRK